MGDIRFLCRGSRGMSASSRPTHDATASTASGVLAATPGAACISNLSQAAPYNLAAAKMIFNMECVEMVEIALDELPTLQANPLLQPQPVWPFRVSKRYSAMFVSQFLKKSRELFVYQVSIISSTMTTSAG